MKSKLKGAETGHSLLKRKSEALTKYELYPLQEMNYSLTGISPIDAFAVS
jgi:vacuolar-type H+-ATPase subunit D/Vma8